MKAQDTFVFCVCIRKFRNNPPLLCTTIPKIVPQNRPRAVLLDIRTQSDGWLTKALQLLINRIDSLPEPCGPDEIEVKKFFKNFKQQLCFARFNLNDTTCLFTF